MVKSVSPTEHVMGNGVTFSRNHEKQRFVLFYGFYSNFLFKGWLSCYWKDCFPLSGSHGLIRIFFIDTLNCIIILISLHLESNSQNQNSNIPKSSFLVTQAVQTNDTWLFHVNHSHPVYSRAAFFRVLTISDSCPHWKLISKCRWYSFLRDLCFAILISLILSKKRPKEFHRHPGTMWMMTI